VAWAILIAAGLCEIAWALALKASDGLRRPLPSAAFAVMLAFSMALLARALRDLPVGTAYAVWTGVGAVGTALLAIVLLGEAASPLRLIGIALIVGGIVALRLAG
jgi:quaternary ammonium compound-resistance protein SugE